MAPGSVSVPKLDRFTSLTVKSEMFVMVVVLQCSLFQTLPQDFIYVNQKNKT